MLTSRQSNVFPSRGANGSSLTARFELDVSDESSGWPDSMLVTAAVSSASFVIVTFCFFFLFFVFTLIESFLQRFEIWENPFFLLLFLLLFLSFFIVFDFVRGKVKVGLDEAGVLRKMRSTDPQRSFDVDVHFDW